MIWITTKIKELIDRYVEYHVKKHVVVDGKYYIYRYNRREKYIQYFIDGTNTKKGSFVAKSLGQLLVIAKLDWHEVKSFRKV